MLISSKSAALSLLCLSGSAAAVNIPRNSHIKPRADNSAQSVAAQSTASSPNAAQSSGAGVSLSISTSGQRNKTAPLLYGWMFEDISHSGDGGLYGELLSNRAFEGSDFNYAAKPGYASNAVVSQENPTLAGG